MYRTIDIEGREVAFSANGATPMLYRMTFQEDLLKKVQNPSEEDMFDLLPRLAYVMAMQGEGKVKGLSFEGMLEWLSGFEPLMIEMHGDEIINIFYSQQEESVELKKKAITE